MKIGIDARFYGPQHAGLGRYTKNLVDQLAQIDSTNEYVIYLGHDNFSQFQSGNSHFTTKLAPFGHYSVQEQLHFPQLLRQDNLDIVHFPHLNVPLRYNGSFVVTIHDLIMHKFRNRAVTTKFRPVYEAKHLGYRLVTRSAAQKSQRILVPSRAVKDELLHFYHLPESKIVVTYEAADDKRQETGDETKEAGVLNAYHIDKPFIMYVGNVYPHKNIELLAKALPDLHRRYGLSLVLPSARGVFLERTEAMMRRAGVREWVVLPGYVPDDELAILYKAATAYVFPTLAEGFGLPPLEAMMVGLPVVVSDIPVLREICGEAALYIDPYNPQTVVTQIGRIVDEVGLRQTLIEKGRQRVKDFSWRRMAEQTLAVYEEVGSKQLSSKASP